MIAFLDCSTGASGDKLLGALLDAGTRSGTFTATELRSIVGLLAPEAAVEVTRVSSHGISALSVRVDATEEPTHRHLSDIERIICAAQLPAPVERDALAAFRALANAEAHVHGTGVNEVHFHEVGALDAIVDIVGVCAGVHALGIRRLICTPVAVGAGVVEAAHGTLPVPAPATLELLRGTPVHGGPVRDELTTPTGAALLGVLVDEFGPCPAMVPGHSGYGAGTRDLGIPNVCRIVLGDADGRQATLESQTVAVLEANIDHISPEAAAVAVQQLLDEGCLDAWTSPIVMKKGRSAFSLSVMVPAHSAEKFASRLVVLTGTLGVRTTTAERWACSREQGTVETPFGPVRFKRSAAGARAEADDVARIARETGRSFVSVADELECYLT